MLSASRWSAPSEDDPAHAKIVLFLLSNPVLKTAASKDGDDNTHLHANQRYIRLSALNSAQPGAFAYGSRRQPAYADEKGIDESQQGTRRARA
ncbi:MAG: hypothetical protein ACRDPY_20005 [Streptosporangiaceae bacterium]